MTTLDAPMNAVPGYTYTDHAQHIADACHPDSGLHLFALVDVAQFHGQPSTALKRFRGLQQQCGWAEPDALYTDTFAAGAQALSPLLQPLPMHRDGEAAASETIAALSDLFIDAPVLSFIASPTHQARCFNTCEICCSSKPRTIRPFFCAGPTRTPSPAR